MLFLIFSIGAECYGLRTSCIERVLPLVALDRMTQVPDYVAGLMNFHGTAVPIIDLSLLASGQPCARSFDTRIILVNYVGTNGASHALGLMAEHVSGMRQLNAACAVDAGVARVEAPYLGEVMVDATGIVQLMDVAALLPAAVQEILFQSAQVVSC